MDTNKNFFFQTPSIRMETITIIKSWFFILHKTHLSFLKSLQLGSRQDGYQ